MIIHIAGYIGAGKSTIAKYIAKKFDFHYLSADLIAKQLYVLPEVIAWFEKNIPECLDNSNRINLKKLRTILFYNKNLNRKLLNEITIPRVSTIIEEQVKSHPNQDFVLESVIKDIIGNISVDYTIVVIAEREVILERILERDGREKSETSSILDFQKPFIEAIILANKNDPTLVAKFQIINSDNGDTTKKFALVDAIINKIKK